MASGASIVATDSGLFTLSFGNIKPGAATLIINRSADEGANWRAVGEIIPPSVTQSFTAGAVIRMDPHSHDLVIAAADPDGSQTLWEWEIYKSHDLGSTWT